jgi:hypothetical protein
MLTDTALRALKPKAATFRKSDAGGLLIQVHTNGSKLWRLAYRFDGKQKLLSGGRYPEVGLADARKWRDAAKVQLAAGVDPSAARKAAEREAKSPF